MLICYLLDFLPLRYNKELPPLTHSDNGSDGNVFCVHQGWWPRSQWMVLQVVKKVVMQLDKQLSLLLSNELLSLQNEAKVSQVI